jgi:hypothetical protein
MVGRRVGERNSVRRPGVEPAAPAGTAHSQLGHERPVVQIGYLDALDAGVEASTSAAITSWVNG